MPRDPLEVVVTPLEEEYYMVWRIVEYGPPDSHGGRGRLAWFPEGEAEAAEFFVHAPADTDRLLSALEEAHAETVRLRGRLAELEWAWHGGGCPACSATPEQGHRPGCWMPEELAR
jgi:hypothetical protein